MNHLFADIMHPNPSLCQQKAFIRKKLNRRRIIFAGNFGPIFDPASLQSQQADVIISQKQRTKTEGVNPLCYTNTSGFHAF